MSKHHLAPMTNFASDRITFTDQIIRDQKKAKTAYDKKKEDLGSIDRLDEIVDDENFGRRLNDGFDMRGDD